MSAVPVVPAAAGGGLHLRRCVRHASREAAARCPACEQYFCRECVVEHEGRLLCSSCLARSAGAAGRGQRRWARVRRAAALSSGVLVLWCLLYLLGLLLLRIPPDYHDGTVWKGLVDPNSP